MSITRAIASIAAAIAASPAFAGRSSVNWNAGDDGLPPDRAFFMPLICLVGGFFLGMWIMGTSVGKWIGEKFGDLGAIIVIYGTPMALAVLTATAIPGNSSRPAPAPKTATSRDTSHIPKELVNKDGTPFSGEQWFGDIRCFFENGQQTYCLVPLPETGK